MRRRKVKHTDELKDVVKEVTQFIPNDIAYLRKELDKLEEQSSNLVDMKHKDYINSRKVLMNIIKKSQELRVNILETYKLFTEEI